MAKTFIEFCNCKRISIHIKQAKKRKTLSKPEVFYTAHFHLSNGFPVSLRIPSHSEETRELVTKAIEKKDFSCFNTTFAVLQTSTACIAAPVNIDENNTLVFICGTSFTEQLMELSNL